MDTKLEMVQSVIQKVDKLVVYGAGEFASLFVQYCCREGLDEKIENCIVTRREVHTPAHILGIPVMELEAFESSQDILIIVAILSQTAQQDVETVLYQGGYKNLYFLSKEEFRALNVCLADFSAGIRYSLIQQQILQAQKQYENLSLLVQKMPLVAETHKLSFGKYKDINRGKTIVVCATGPSLNRYAFDERYIHIGMNSLLFNDRIRLDYYFNQHIPPEYNFWNNEFDLDPIRRKRYLENIPKMECVKFIGQAIGNSWYISPPFGEFSNPNYHIYYFSDIDTTYHFTADIRYGLMYGATSVVFAALQFALFTNPKRIFLIGCDGYSISNANYYSKDSYDETYLEKYLKYGETVDGKEAFLRKNDTIREGYKEFRRFAAVHYPNTEIIMVNPVHYKGIFRETTTDKEGHILL